jgi:hypothetical protein
MARANRHFLPGYVWHITHVRGVKERLGIRAKGRKVVRGESRFELREISAPYVDGFSVS